MTKKLTLVWNGKKEAVLRESEKRADWSTHWRVQSEIRREKEANAEPTPVAAGGAS